MQLSFKCRHCNQTNLVDLTAESDRVLCDRCKAARPIKEADLENEKPQRCLACGCNDLWRQKDFPQGLGILIVATAAILSTIAWAKMEPTIAIGILMGFGLFDFLLYFFRKDVLVCYRCQAQHRRVALDESDPRFDLEINERYRQEAIRLEESKKT
jgi:hypothetical protein